MWLLIKSRKIPVPVAGGRLVLSGTGDLSRDFDDVRRFSDAAQKGIKRVVQAGSRAPLIVIHYSAKSKVQELFANHIYVAVLGALSQSYLPLEVREDSDAPLSVTATAERIFVYSTDEKLPQHVSAIESARAVARDLCGYVVIIKLLYLYSVYCCP